MLRLFPPQLVFVNHVDQNQSHKDNPVDSDCWPSRCPPERQLKVHFFSFLHRPLYGDHVRHMSSTEKRWPSLLFPRVRPPLCELSQGLGVLETFHWWVVTEGTSVNMLEEINKHTMLPKVSDGEVEGRVGPRSTRPHAEVFLSKTQSHTAPSGRPPLVIIPTKHCGRV